MTILYTTQRDLLLVDMIATDINSDGIQDVLAVLRRSDGQTFILEVVFTDSLHTSHYSSELAFESQGIKQVLGVFDVNRDGKNDFVYLSSYNQLAYVANFDPVYTSFVIWGETLDVGPRLNSFYILDFDKDGLTDFIIPVTGNLLLIEESPNSGWQKKILNSSDIKDIALVTLRKDALDFVLLWGTEVAYLAQTQILEGSSVNDATYIWTSAEGKTFCYILSVFDIRSDISWSRVDSADLVGDGELDLVLYSSTQRTIGWGRRSVQGSDLGWNPDFWMILMVYVLAMSLALGLAHTAYVKRLKRTEMSLLNLPPGLEFKAPTHVDPDNLPKAKRKITV
mmetsp:Transcript_26713/g.48119  ORF Transcript_26713/g.48119 Transcript_26713/m.48119 type:complete len:338 (+) Transcript_26713:810-1823(+)